MDGEASLSALVGQRRWAIAHVPSLKPRHPAVLLGEQSGNCRHANSELRQRSKRALSTTTTPTTRTAKHSHGLGCPNATAPATASYDTRLENRPRAQHFDSQPGCCLVPYAVSPSRPVQRSYGTLRSRLQVGAVPGAETQAHAEQKLLLRPAWL